MSVKPRIGMTENDLSREFNLSVLRNEVRSLQASLKRHQDKLLEVSAKHMVAGNMAEQLAASLVWLRGVAEHDPTCSNNEVCSCGLEAADEASFVALTAYRAWKERGATAKVPAKWMNCASATGALFEVADEIRGQWKDRDTDHLVSQNSMYDLNWAVDWVGQTAEAMDMQPLPDCDIEGLREWVSRMEKDGHLDADGCREFNSLFDFPEALLVEPATTEREDENVAPTTQV